MAKLTLWVAHCIDDDPCYSVLGKTRKECLLKVGDDSDLYEKPVKITIEYKDAFDLFEKSTGESGGRTGWL